MKKIISLLLVLVMCLGLFAACAEKGPTLEDAVNYLNSAYRSDDGKTTPANYQMPAQLPVNGVKFDVSWACSLDSIQIVLENGLYTVKVPGKNETETEYTLTATIKDAKGSTATVTMTRVLPVYDNSAAVTEPEENHAYKFFMVQADLGKTLFATTDTQKENGQDKYIKTDVDPKKGADFYAEKVEGGYKFYTMVDGVKMYLHAFLVEKEGGKVSKHIGFDTEGDCVFTYKTELKTWFITLNNYDYGVGTYGTFATVCISENTHFTADAIGTKQFPLTLMDKTAAEALTPTEGPADPTELTTIPDFTAIAEALENQGSGTVEKYLVKGVITEIKSEQFGNMYIEDADGNKLYVYGLYSADGETRYDAMETKPQVGDTVTLMGIACNYNGAQMKNAWLKELVPGEGGGNEDEGGETTVLVPELVTNPEIGKAYKMGLLSTAKNATYFFTGEMNGYYGATSTTMTEGIDVSLEDAGNGAYYITFTVDGAKKYIGTEISGTHLNFKIVEEADRATFTWNADNKTFYTMMGENETFMGTSGNYVTFGMMTTDKVADSYAAHLYIGVPGEAGEGGGNEDEGGNTPAEEVKNGDTIILNNEGKYVTGTDKPYNNKSQLAMSDNKSDALVLTVKIDNGIVTFVTADGKFLYADGTHVKLVDEEGEFTKFVLEDAEGGKYIRCNTANYNGKAQYLEVYSGSLTCYGMGSNTAIYTFQMQDPNAAGDNGSEGGETETETFTAFTGTLNVVMGEEKQYMVALDGGWVTATTVADEAGVVIIEFNADSTKAKIKVGGKYIAPKGGKNNGIQEGEYVWAVVKTADNTYKFMGQGEDAVTLGFNSDGNGMKFRAYKNTTYESKEYPCEFTFTAK